MAFTNEQLKRYSRHIILKEIGVKGQKKLLNARVLISEKRIMTPSSPMPAPACRRRHAVCWAERWRKTGISASKRYISSKIPTTAGSILRCLPRNSSRR